MKSKNPNTLLSLLTVLAVAVTIVPSTALAVCPLDSSAYILLHPVFENTYRYATARTTNLFTTDTLCSSHPRAFAISRHQNFNVAAFIGRNDSLFVMRSENYNTVCAVTVEYLAPVQVASGLSFPATSPLFVLSQGKTTYDTTAIILASGPSTFEVLTVLTETGTVIQRTSKTVTMQVAGQTITNFNSSFNSATHRDTMLWVTGTKGMIRRFPISTTGIGSESSFDIASTQNVLCYGDGYAGTASGALFRLQSGTFSQQTSLGKAIRYVRTSVATGDNGLVAVRSSGTWKTYTAGSSSYRFANLVGPPDGSSVELLDSAWQYTLHTYADSPTVIATITPVQLVSSINSAPFVFNPQNGSMNIGVSLSDIDGNHAAPSVILHTLRGGTRSLTNDGLYDLPRGNSDISCSIGTIAPKDSTYSLVVRADSLLLRKNCLIGTINASCGTCYFAPYTFQSRQSWVQGDTVVFIASTDTLRITHGGGATVTVQQNISNTVSEFICSMYGNAIIVSFPRRSSNSVNNVSLFDARGRRLANVPVSNDMTSVRISTPLQSAIVYACISLSDGSVIRKILPLLR